MNTHSEKDFHEWLEQRYGSTPIATLFLDVAPLLYEDLLDEWTEEQESMLSYLTSSYSPDLKGKTLNKDKDRQKDLIEAVKFALYCATTKVPYQEQKKTHEILIKKLTAAIREGEQSC